MSILQLDKAGQKLTESLKNKFVVDADIHLEESPQDLAPYCEMPWQKSLEALEGVSLRYLDIPGFAPGGVRLSAPFPGGHNIHRKAQDIDQMRSELTVMGIDVGVLFPNNLLKIAVLPQADYASALARAYNAWLLDKWCSHERGLFGCILAAPQRPDEAAREIARYAQEKSVVGVLLPTAGLEPFWGHERYDPIYQAAEEANLPVLYHSVTLLHPTFPHQLHTFESEFARHTLGHPFSLIVNLVSIVTTGVPVRFPDLKIGFVEGGLSWVPFIMNRLDKEYLERRREVPILQDRPSHYIKKFYFATQPIDEPEDPNDIAKIIQLFGGEDRVMFASDWPHHDFDHPSTIMQLPLDNDLKAKILGGNASDFFGFNKRDFGY
jgi:predicted TIM-barrel fold metal-dependent hydrolase